MNKHAIILPLLLVSATALLLTSLSLPPDEVGPPVIASGTPSSEPSSEPSDASSNEPSAKPSPEASSAASGEPSSEPSPEASAEPSPEVSEEPSPSPSPSSLPSYGIAATSSDSVLREAKIHTGRTDPFKNVYPPDLPEFTTALEPEQMALPELIGPPELPTSTAAPIFEPRETPNPEMTPPPPSPLEQGLKLKGIIGGGIDPIALIEVDGQTELLRVGERLRGNILVTSIHYENKRVTLSRGQQKGLLVIPSPDKTPF